MKIKTWNDFYNFSADVAEACSDDELTALLNRLTCPLFNSPMDKADNGEYTPRQCKEVERVYWLIHDVLDERYKRENAPAVRAYFKDHFEGKSWEEIQSANATGDWDIFSDWHKDTFGHRPHGIRCD